MLGRKSFTGKRSTTPPRRRSVSSWPRTGHSGRRWPASRTPRSARLSRRSSRCSSNNLVLALKIKLVPEESVVKLHVGDPIRLTEDEFERLSAAFVADLDRKFL